tara:strand:- start:164 stop:442 length:279 start_codon:yes stop_codon:yes gene_type:complete
MIAVVVAMLAFSEVEPHTIQHFDKVYHERVMSIATLEAAQNRLKWRVEVMLHHPRLRNDYKALADTYKELHDINIKLHRLKMEHNRHIGGIM